MVKQQFIAVVAVVITMAVCGDTSGAVIVNEVMANEPGSSTTLEWVELYNSGQFSANLSLCQINVGGSSVALTGSMPAGSYLIICRQLYASGSTPGFESVWGDSSGVWGDTSIENYPIPVAAAFSLANGADSVTLTQPGSNPSVIRWSESGKDGFSWERAAPTLSEIRQSVDYSGSTPAFVNSVTPVEGDLSLDTVTVASVSSGAEIGLTITNLGAGSVVGRRLLIRAMNPAMPDSLGEILDSITVPTLFGGFSTDVVRELAFTGVYKYLIAALDTDNRIRNNRKAFVAPGADFPPLILTELMPDPQTPLTSEWIEIYCPLATSFNFQSWRVADAADTGLLSSGSFSLGAGEYAVLAEDSTAFRLFYTDFSGTLIQPPQWLSLNNDGDMIQLIDAFGNPADSFAYAHSWGNNYTWGRPVDSSAAEWGRSVAVGGTPGRTNDVVIEPADQKLALNIEPRVFSPDGNGFEDVTEITIEAPQATSYTLKIYDRDGRAVRTLADHAELLRRAYQWDGRTDSGRELPIGIYICYFEATGVQSVKKTVVIAR